MKLANPIYDTVFKYLMEDTEIARQYLSQIIEGMLIEQEVEEILDQHIREKEALMDENQELKGGLQERDEKLEEQNRLIEELKKQLKDKK